MPHPQSNHEAPITPKPSPQVTLLTSWSEAGQRVRSAALAHYVHALVATIEDFFVEHQPTQGMDLCLAAALLPDGESIVRAELRPNALSESTFTELLGQVQALPRPPVRGGPVAFLVQSLVVGGRQDRLGPPFRNDVPAGFASALKKAEAEFTVPPPRPSVWARAMAGWRRALCALGKALFPPVVAKPAPTNACSLKEEERTLERLTEMIENRPNCDSPYLWRGQLYHERQEYEAAIADYSEYLARKPGDAQVYFNRGVCHHSSGSREKALADYNEALWRNPRAAAALMRRAWLFFELEAFERALQDATAATETDPEEPEWLLGRAKMLAAQGKFDAALVDLDRAVQLDPHHFESLLIRAMVYRDKPSPQDQVLADCRLAIAGFTAALRVNREYVPAYAHRAEMRQQLDDLEGAMADCEQAIRRDPHYGFSYAIRGHVHLRQGDRRKAIADCTEALRLGIDGWMVQLTLADAHLGENELEEALAACDAALKLSPKHAGGLVLRAKVQMQMGSLDAAAEDTSAAIDVAPAWNVPYAIRGNLHGLRGDTASALVDLDEALRLEPADATAHYNRGVARFHLKEFAKSLEDLNEAERLGYRAAMLYFMRATVRLQQAEPERARQDLDEALRIDPECAPALDTRANLLLNEGRRDAAMKDYNELVRLFPNIAAAYSGRARAWIHLGEEEKAGQDFQEAAQLDPGNAEAYAIQRLLTEAAFHHNREDFQQAIARASEAIQAEPACGPAYALRAAAYWYTEHHVEAVDDYNTLMEMEENPSFAALSGRGQVYAEMGEFQSGLDDLNRAIDLESQGLPPRAVAYALSGRALARAGLGCFEEAAQDFESSIRNCPANAWVHYNHGLMHHQLGNPDAAVVCFQLALELREPALPPRKRDRARGYIRRYRKADEAPAAGAAGQEPAVAEGKGATEQQKMSGSAQAAESHGDWKGAEAYLRELLKLTPEDLATHERLARSLFSQGKVDEAYEVLKKAKQIDRDHAKQNNTREAFLAPEAIMAQYYDRYEGPASPHPEKWFQAAIAAAPDDLNTRQAVAIWALVKGKIAFAKEQAVAALRIEASDAKKYSGSYVGHILRGLVGLWEKDWAEAESCFQKVINESPSDFAARNNIALALVEQDDPAKKQRALDYAEANLRDLKNNPDALSTLGWVHVRRNEFDQAGAALDQAVKAAGGKPDPDTATYLAHLLHHRGQDQEAKAILAPVLENGRPFSMRPEALRLYEELK